jgi:hypothetical protein
MLAAAFYGFMPVWSSYEMLQANAKALMLT